MIHDLEDYIEEHISSQPVYLKKIDRLTNIRYVNGRMCSGHIQGRLLKMFTAMIRPKRVLELGTFTGYSALCMAEALDEDALIDTVEVDDEFQEIILKNFDEADCGAKIRLHIGEALEIMKNWPDDYFDMAFIDADKRQYPAYFKTVINLIRPGGFIIADNTLWDGHVTESCRHSSQTSGIIEFNELVATYPGIEVAIVPVRDGMTIIRKL